MITARIFNSIAWARNITARSLGTALSTGTQNVAPKTHLICIKEFQPVNFAAPLNVSSLKPLKRIEEIPLHNIVIESPRSTLLNEIQEIIRKNEVMEAPPVQNQNTEIRAARLIVIRRRKMKKHKLKKLRKKMKFDWAKVRQRREMRKEKAFQAELLAQIREAEKFSADEYVNEKLRKANETPIPRYWKGRRLPQFIIKQKLGIK